MARPAETSGDNRTVPKPRRVERIAERALGAAGEAGLDAARDLLDLVVGDHGPRRIAGGGAAASPRAAAGRSLADLPEAQLDRRPHSSGEALAGERPRPGQVDRRAASRRRSRGPSWPYGRARRGRARAARRSECGTGSSRPGRPSGAVPRRASGDPAEKSRKVRHSRGRRSRRPVRRRPHRARRGPSSWGRPDRDRRGRRATHPAGLSRSAGVR